MQELPKLSADTKTIGELVGMATSGELRLPAFQRAFRWEAGDIERLFDSIQRGYPIGNLLFWKREAPADSVRFGPWEGAFEGRPDALWVVDGQQRLSSLVGVLARPDHVTNPDFSLFFDLRTENLVRPSRRRIPPSYWLPMNHVLDSRLLDWLLKFQAAGGEKAQVDAATALATRIRQYDVPTYTVETPDEQVLREIFDRLNASGKRMRQAEVFHALHVGAGDSEPADFRSLDGAVAELGFGRFDESILLRVVLALRGPDVFRDFREEFAPGEDPATAYRSAETALAAVIDFLRADAGIPHRRALPYALVVPVLARFFHLFPDPEPRTRILLRRWVWRGAVLGVQDAGFTPALRRAVRAIDHDEHASVQTLLSQLRPVTEPPSLALNATRLNEAAAKANLALMAALGPLDLASGKPIDVTRLLDDEESPLRVSVEGHAPRTVAATLLHPPVDDLEGLILSASAETLASHGIPTDDLQLLRRGDWAAFIEARAAVLRERLTAIRDALAEWGSSDRPALSALVIPDDPS